MITLVGLPSELLFYVFRKIRIQDILSLRQTCHFLYDVTHERSVWFDVLHVMSVQQHLPLPGLNGRRIIDMSSKELEILGRKASRYHQNWRSQNPTAVRILDIESSRFSLCPGVRVLGATFLPGKGGRYLITSSFLESRLDPRSVVVHCWDLDEEIPRCIATLVFPTFAAVLVNREVGHHAALAITRRSSDKVQSDGEPITSTYSINLECTDPDTGFSHISTFSSSRYPIVLSGSQVYTANYNHNTIQMFNTETGEKLCDLCPPIQQDVTLGAIEDFKPLDAIVWGRYFLVFRQRWIHLYERPSLQAEKLSLDSEDEISRIRPVATYEWAWRIDSLQVSAQETYTTRHARFMSQPPPSNDPPLIDILVRFDSWYPWPVNFLHHLTLSPDVSSSTSIPYLGSSKPRLEAAISSHMRLFTPSDMAIGEYGTALWIDSQSDLSTTAWAGDLSQRLAGKVLRRCCNSSLGDDKDSPGLRGLIQNTLEQEEKQGEFPDPVSVYGVWETYSEWTKVAVEEREGRIALGSVEGRVCIMDYVRRSR